VLVAGELHKAESLFVKKCDCAACSEVKCEFNLSVIIPFAVYVYCVAEI